MLLFKLFYNFFYIGMLSIGGGYAAIPLIQGRIVEATGLMTFDEFTDLITIAEMTPGSIAINAATFLGNRLSGIPGAVICTLGVVLPSFIICYILAHFYYKYKGLDSVSRVLAALRPAVVAMIASAAVSILISGLFDGEAASLSNLHIPELLLFAAGLFLLRKFHLNPILIIFGTGVVGTVIYGVMGLFA